MKKRFWATIVFISFLVAGTSGGYVYWALLQESSSHMAVKEISAKDAEKIDQTAVDESPSPPSEATEDPAMDPPEGDSEKTNLKAEDVKPVQMTKATQKEDVAAKRNILFTFYSGSAKNVFIIGDFNNWFREPLTQEGNAWTVEIPIAPGTYEYQYVVNDRKIKDPYNKRVSKSGKSILTVNPQ